MKIDHSLTESRRRLLAFALGALIAAAAAIRFSTLAVQSYWDDEAATVSLVKRDFWNMLRTIPKTESTPPLYYVLAWPWARLSGTSETALRSLSALFGTATVLVVYLAAKELSSRRVALVAAALVACNPFLVWYSQEARSYALYAFLASLSFLFFVRFLRQPKTGFLWSWAIASALALLSHYFAIFLVAPEAAWLAVRARRRRPVFVAIALVAAIGLALIPLARHQEQKPELMAKRARLIHGEAGREFSTRELGAKTVGNTSLAVRVLRIPKTFLVGGEIPAKREVTAIAGVLILAAIWLLAFRATARDRRAATPAIGIGAAMIAIPIFLAAGGKDYVLPYYLIAAIVPFSIAVATGFAVSRVGLVLAAALCVLSLGLVASVDATPRYQRENWRGAAKALGPPRVNRALVVTPSDITTLLTDTPLPLYQPRLRQIRVGGGASVSEIDILAVRVTGSALPTRLARVPHRPFSLAAKEKDETFTIFRYVSPRPVHVTRQGLLKSHLGNWPPHRITIFTQPRGPSS